jgi:hypothetical protein
MVRTRLRPANWDIYRPAGSVPVDLLALRERLKTSSCGAASIFRFVNRNSLVDQITRIARNKRVAKDQR